MADRLFLFTYDVCDPKRLVRVHRCLKSRALALQYSVFVLEGSTDDALAARSAVANLIDPTQDDVRIYALPDGVEVEPLGATSPLPSGVLLVGAGATLAMRVPPGRGAGAEVGLPWAARNRGRPRRKARRR